MVRFLSCLMVVSGMAAAALAFQGPDMIPELELLRTWYLADVPATSGIRDYLPGFMRNVFSGPATPAVPLQAGALETAALQYREKWLLPMEQYGRSFQRNFTIRDAVLQRADVEDMFVKGHMSPEVVEGLPKVVQQIAAKEKEEFKKKLEGAARKLAEIMGTATEFAELASGAEAVVGNNNTPDPPRPTAPDDNRAKLEATVKPLVEQLGVLQGAKRLRDAAEAIASGRGVTESQAGQVVQDVTSVVETLKRARGAKVPGLNLSWSNINGVEFSGLNINGLKIDLAALGKRAANLSLDIGFVKDELRKAGKDWHTHLGAAVDAATKIGLDPRAAQGIKNTVNTVVAFASGNYVGAVMGMASMFGMDIGGGGDSSAQQMDAISRQLAEINVKLDKLQESVDRLEAKLDDGLLRLQARLNRIEFKIDLLTAQRAMEHMTSCGSIVSRVDQRRHDLGAWMGGLVTGLPATAAENCRKAVTDVLVSIKQPAFGVYAALHENQEASEQVTARLKYAFDLEREFGHDPVLSIRPELLPRDEKALTTLLDVGYVLGAARSVQLAAWLELFNGKWEGLADRTPRSLLAFYGGPDRAKMQPNVGLVFDALKETLVLVNHSLWQMKAFSGIASVANARDGIFNPNTSEDALAKIRKAIACNEKTGGAGCTTPQADNVVRMRLRSRLTNQINNDSYREFAETLSKNESRATALTGILCHGVQAGRCRVILSSDVYRFQLLTVDGKAVEGRMPTLSEVWRWRMEAEPQIMALLQAREDVIDALAFLDGPWWSEGARYQILKQIHLRPFNAVMRRVPVFARTGS